MNKDQTQVFIVSISTRRARGDVFDALGSPFSIFTSITVNTHGSDPSFIRARPAGARPPLHTSVRPFSSRMHFRHARARGVVASRERTRARRARIKSHRRLDARSPASARRARRRVASRASGARHARDVPAHRHRHITPRARASTVASRRARCRARVRIKWRTTPSPSDARRGCTRRGTTPSVRWMLSEAPSTRRVRALCVARSRRARVVRSVTDDEYFFSIVTEVYEPGRGAGVPAGARGGRWARGRRNGR